MAENHLQKKETILRGAFRTLKLKNKKILWGIPIILTIFSLIVLSATGVIPIKSLFKRNYKYEDSITYRISKELKKKDSVDSTDSLKNKVRYIAFTDIEDGAEVDDIQSMYRLLLYSNELNIEGLITNTSTFVKHINYKNTDVIHEIIEKYDGVKNNLDRHAENFPSANYLHSVTVGGINNYGNEAGKDFASQELIGNEGVDLFLRAAEKNDDRPIYIGLWGGANTLAQALWEYENSHTLEEFNKLLSKLRIYGISDQDNASHWLRENYGDRLSYIVTPSKGTAAGSDNYYRAVWPGISSDKFKHGSEDGEKNGGFTGADFHLFDNEWIKKNIQNVSSYGEGYPLPTYISEGDTPAFLWAIPNGLNIPESPDLGGWGGRYQFYLPDPIKDVPEEKFPIWTNTKDRVIGNDGKEHISPQATLWRWRKDFQEDFAARMLWTSTKDSQISSHIPKIENSWNNSSAHSGEEVELNVTIDEPERYNFVWTAYQEIGGVDFQLSGNGPNAIVKVPENISNQTQLHVIVRVSEKKENAAVKYARFVITVD